MSIIKEELQSIQCDNCQDTYQDDDSGYAYWMDPNDAWESANNDGWTEEDGKHYCDKCHEYNDEDELVIDKTRSMIMNLQMSLKKKWFEMTKAEIKPEDYRAITPYFCNKFLLFNGENLSKEQWRVFLITSGVDYLILCIGKEITFKNFSINIMTLGYPKANDTEKILKLKHKGIEIRTGKPEWGAEPGKLYFVIKHGFNNTKKT